jgi:hypothetical protein
MPTTANWESQYVNEVRVTITDDVSTTRCTAGSKSVPSCRSVRSTHSPFWKASATLRSAAPRATWYAT